MGKRILIVDDEADIIMLVKVRLESQGYEVSTAGNGKEGLELVAKEKFDLIISDVLMPEMDGFEFCKALKTDPQTAPIPILVLTARGKMEDTFVSLGVADFIAKPFVPQEFLEKVKKALALGEATAKEMPPAPPQEEPVSPKPPAPAPVNIKKILLGCSTISITQTIQKWAKAKKYGVAVASSGQEVLNKAGEYKPDLILLDVFLDDKSSSDIINKLKKVKDLKQIPILIYTFLDKDKLEGISLPQRKMEIETAKNVCMHSGVKECITDVSDPSFTSILEKYLV